MKITFILFFFLVFAFRVTAQNISVHIKNARLNQALQEIAIKAGYEIWLNKDIKASLATCTQPVNLKLDAVNLDNALEKCLRNTPFTYVKVGREIIILPKTIHGRVTNENREPIAGVSVSVIGYPSSTVSSSNGEFAIKDATPNFVIQFSGVNVETHEEAVGCRSNMGTIRLKTKVTALSTTEVQSTGYQDLNAAKSTAAAAVATNEMINRRISTNVFELLDGMAPGLQRHSGKNGFNIRGTSTIHANAQPLIIVDNFPYYGDIRMINPNDIESITILKDAAAASILGVNSGNGVIVIKKKSGKFNQQFSVSFTSSFQLTEKPDLFYLPQLSSSEYMEIERWFFNRRYYDGFLASGYKLVSTVVEIEHKRRLGILTDPEADKLLADLRKIDARNDYRKWFYRLGFAQQYAISLRGGEENYWYHLSLGYDKTNSSQVRSSDWRGTIKLKLGIALLKKLKLEAGMAGAIMRRKNDFEIRKPPYPYAALTDSLGRAAIVPADLSQIGKENAVAGLLDWNYRPLEDINLRDHENVGKDIQAQLSVTYKPVEQIEVSLACHYNGQNFQETDYFSPKSYTLRHLVNKFAQVKPDGVYFAFPIGGIKNTGATDLRVTHARLQGEYNGTIKESVEIRGIIGTELVDMVADSNIIKGLSMHDDHVNYVDYNTPFPLSYDTSRREKIPFGSSYDRTVIRYLSGFGNLIVNVNSLVTFSLSGRIDQSNLFGSKANQNATPLWSAGIGWNVSRSAFYEIDWLPFLKTRASYGYNGNLDRSGATFAIPVTDGPNYYGGISASFTGVGTPELQHEKVSMINFGLDFASKRRRVAGSFDYYIRRSKDLVSDAPLDPTTGNLSHKANTASMKGHGYEINLRASLGGNSLSWHSHFMLSCSKDRVTSYPRPGQAAWYQAEDHYFNTQQGLPLKPLMAFKWAGLDSTGNPQGLLKGAVSTNYAAILEDTSSLRFVGSKVPAYFATWANKIKLLPFEIYLMLSYKGGYYLRRESISYTGVFTGRVLTHVDYRKRWQKKGDENSTSVPALPEELDPLRELFYEYAEPLVERGDHIRLQDLRISYHLDSSLWKRLKLRSALIYVTASNLGIIWRATNADLDPDNIGTVPRPKSWAIGIRFEL